MDKFTATDYKKNKMRERRKRDRKHKKHLKNIAETVDSFRSTIFDTGKYFKHGWRKKLLSKFVKKQNNDNVRNSDEEELYQGSEYKKLGDFWWKYW